MGCENNAKLSTAKLMIQSDQLYGFTLNPKEQCYYGNDFSEIFPRAYISFIHNILNYRELLPYIELYPEYSSGRETVQLDKYPRLHFHGAVQIDEDMFYPAGVMLLHQNFTYSINENVDSEYCLKNKQVMLRKCVKNGLPYQLTWDTIDKFLNTKEYKYWSAVVKEKQIDDETDYQLNRLVKQKTFTKVVKQRRPKRK